MGLKELFSRWTKARDDDALARAERETHMTQHERDVDQQDYEARKDDLEIGRSFAGGEADEAAANDLD